MTLSRTFLTLVLPLASGVLLAACGEEATRPVVPPELEGIEADNVIYGFEYTLTRKGVREAVAYAEEGYAFPDSTVFHLKGDVRLLTYDAETGLPIAEITSDWGRLNTSSNALIARGNAVLVLQDQGRRIESAELNFAPERNEIWSDSASVMYTDQGIVEGTGFDSDLQFRQPTIRNARTRQR